MSILLHCSSCKNSFGQKMSQCPKCGIPVHREKVKYRVQVMVKGRRMSAIANSRTEAKMTEARLIQELEKNETPATPNYTLNQVFEAYMNGYKNRGKTWLKEERRYQRYLAPVFGEKYLKDISAMNIESFIITLKGKLNYYKKPYSPNTIRHIIDLLSVTFNYAIRMDLFDGKNPCVKVSLPKINNVMENVIAESELKRLLEVLDEFPDYGTCNIFKILLFTGIRSDEAFKLTWKDVNFETRQIFLRNPKGGKDQTLPLNQIALTALMFQKEIVGNNSGLVFPGKNGQKRTNVWPTWQKILKLANITSRFRIHDLRHQYGSLLASSGTVDIYTLQRLMTHKDVRTTQRYAHHFPQALQRGTAEMDTIIGKIVTSTNE